MSRYDIDFVAFDRKGPLDLFVQRSPTRPGVAGWYWLFLLIMVEMLSLRWFGLLI